MQTGVLDWHDVGVRGRRVDVLVPEARRRDEGRALDPVDADGVLDGAVGVQFGAEEGVGSGLRVDYEVQSDRLVAVGQLAGTGGDDAEHRPQGMGDGHGLLEVLVGQQDADAAALRGLGIVLGGFKLGHYGFMSVDRGLEAGGRLLRAEVGEEGRVVDEVEGSVGVSVVDGLERGQSYEVAGLPGDGAVGGLGVAAAVDDVEELAAGVGGAGELLARLDADEAGEKTGAGGGVGGAQGLAQVEWDEAAGTGGVDLGRELPDGYGGGGAGLDGVGRLAVLVDGGGAGELLGGDEGRCGLGAHICRSLGAFRGLQCFFSMGGGVARSIPDP